MVPGFDETLRVNGRAVLSTDPADLALCADARRAPVVVIRVAVESVYLHCAKAFMTAAESAMSIVGKSYLELCLR
jgi:predicted pyridoxine 5'-phosphate oxidase superfamily flavin-nucleotide-binding protein